MVICAMTLAPHPLRRTKQVPRPSLPRTRSVSPLCFQQVVTSFSHNSFLLTFIRIAPGGWGAESETQAKLNPILLQGSAFRRSNALTSLESNSCAIVPANSHGIIFLHKNIRGRRGGGLPTGHGSRATGHAPSHRSHRHTPNDPEANRQGSLKDLNANFQHPRPLATLPTGHESRATDHAS